MTILCGLGTSGGTTMDTMLNAVAASGMRGPLHTPETGLFVVLATCIAVLFRLAVTVAIHNGVTAKATWISIWGASAIIMGAIALALWPTHHFLGSSVLALLAGGAVSAIAMAGSNHP